MGKTGALLGEIIHQFGRNFGQVPHVVTVSGVQNPPGNPVADLPAILAHHGAHGQHFFGDIEFFHENGRRTLLARKFQCDLPTGNGQLPGDFLRELHGFGGSVTHAQQGQRGAKPQEPHAVAAFAVDFLALGCKRQAVDLDHVVEHSRKDAHHLAVLVPVESGPVAERVDHELGQVDRAEQAGAVGGQGLLAAVVDHQAIGIEGIRAGHRGVEHLLLQCRVYRLERCGKSLTIDAPVVIGERRGQFEAFLTVGKADSALENPDVVSADDQLMLRLDRILPGTAPAVGQAPVACVPPVRV